ncbi:MAG: hypothetical protein K0Q76_1039 [Panacagrimonas sp.]|jgi:hypothetical protein|nr:DUF1674 domain-containing protein [Panacagrimonas sp.]MCC2655931.1 hypothetical protein [Panacagrimonas sp.]
MSSPADPVVRSFRPKQDNVVPLAEFLAAKEPKGDVTSPPVPPQAPGAVPEIGGRKSGLEPTRFGDWEKDGRCIDF